MSEVGENGDFNRDTESTELGEGMAGDLQDEKLRLLFGNLEDAAVQSKGVYGGHVAKLWGEVIYTPSDGGHEASLVTGVVQHIPNHKASGSLAIRTSNTNHAELLAGVVELEFGGNRLSEVVGKHGGIIKWEFLQGLFHSIIIARDGGCGGTRLLVFGDTANEFSRVAGGARCPQIVIIIYINALNGGTASGGRGGPPTTG